MLFLKFFPSFKISESYFEIDLVNKLQGVIEKQRGQIKKLDQSILDFKAENEEVWNDYAFFMLALYSRWSRPWDKVF